MPKNIKTKKEEAGNVKEKKSVKRGSKKSVKGARKDNAALSGNVVFSEKKIRPVAQAAKPVVAGGSLTENKEAENDVAVDKSDIVDKNNWNNKNETVVNIGGAGKEQTDKHFAKWTAKDFVRTSDETLFYRASLVATIVVIFWSIKDGNWVSLATFLTLLVVIAFELKSQPRDVQYKIDIDGISIDDRLYKFDDIRSFEIVQKGGNNVLKLQLKNSIFPVKELYLDESQNLAYMQALMEYFLPEEKQEETLFNFNTKKKLTEEEFIDKQVEEYLKEKKL